MKFFKRKSKANRVPNDAISLPSKAPSESPSKAPSTSSRRSKLSRGSKSTKTENISDRTCVDDRQDLNAAAPSLDTEAREDIFFINTITTPSASDTDDDEVSHLTFDEQIVEKTNVLKQYVVDHLLGCVDFIEECAQGTAVKDTTKIEDEAACIDNETTIGVAESETVREEKSFNDHPLMYNGSALFDSALQEIESKQSSRCQPEPIFHTGQSFLAIPTLESEIQSKMIEPATVKSIGNVPIAPSPVRITNDLVADSIPPSGYTNVVPKSPYETIALRSNNDFLLAATNIDAIIDSHVARMCEEMCVCGEMGLCGADDDLSQFQELPPVADDHENMLFQ